MDRQRTPDLFLERLDLVADRPLRDEQLTRSVREAQVARGRTEAAQKVEGQPGRPLPVHEFNSCERQEMVV